MRLVDAPWSYRTDRYGRRLAYVETDAGTDPGEAMVTDGYAEASAPPSAAIRRERRPIAASSGRHSLRVGERGRTAPAWVGDSPATTAPAGSSPQRELVLSIPGRPCAINCPNGCPARRPSRIATALPRALAHRSVVRRRRSGVGSSRGCSGLRSRAAGGRGFGTGRCRSCAPASAPQSGRPVRKPGRTQLPPAHEEAGDRVLQHGPAPAARDCSLGIPRPGGGVRQSVQQDLHVAPRQCGSSCCHIGGVRPGQRQIPHVPQVSWAQPTECPLSRGPSDALQRCALLRGQRPVRVGRHHHQ